MVNLSAQVDTSKFDEAWKKAMSVTSRSLPEFVVSHAYFVVRRAVGTTKAADKEKIAADLMKGSKVDSSIPIAGILINKQRKLTGKPVLPKGKMTQAIVEKFIRIRQAHRNFLRAGWLPAIKKLASLVPRKGGAAKIPSGVKIKGQPKGGATAPPKHSWNPVCEIWNAVQGGKTPSAKATKEIQEGLQEALNLEAADMLQHAEETMRKAFLPFNSD